MRRARALVRRPSARRTNFTLSSTDTLLTNTNEIRESYSGVILVGDSQMRELAWAVLKALTPDDELRFGSDPRQIFSEGKTEASKQRSRRRLRGACLPQTVGKLGFTAVCSRADDANGVGGGCKIYSPFSNASHQEAMKQQWLFRSAAPPSRRVSWAHARVAIVHQESALTP